MDTALPIALGRGRLAVTGSITVTGGHAGLLLDATSGSFTVSLTAAATLGNQWFCFFYNSGTGTVVLDPNSSETIRTPAGLVSTLTLLQGQGCLLSCNATGFEAIALSGLSTGFGWSRRSAISTVTVTTADNGVIIDATNNTFAANLPAAATAGSGFIVGFYDSGPGIFTLTGNGAETIQTTAGTATTLALTTGQGVILSCTGTGWEVIASNGFLLGTIVVFDNAFIIKDNLDNTKSMMFDVGNQATSSNFILNAGSQTTSRTLSVPPLTGSDTLMTENVAQTVTALKSFWDSAFKIVGSADTSKTLKFEVDAQSVNADLTIDSGAQTVDRTLTIPVLTGNRTLALVDQAQTITGLTSFPDNALQVTGSSDATKLLKFEVDAQTTGKTLTFDTGAQTLDRSLSVPVLGGNDTIATLAVANNFSAAQTISNATASTSTTTGAFVVTGGAGYGGAVYGGGIAVFAGSVKGDEVYWGDSTYIGKETYAAGSLVIGSFSNHSLLLYTNSAVAVTIGVDKSIVAEGGLTSIKPAAAANITDLNSSMKFYDGGLGAGLFGMQTSGSPYAFQLQVANASMASQFPLSLNPLGGVVNVGAGGLALAGSLQLNNAYVGTPQVPTGYIIIKDSSGTSYKVSCNV